MTGPERRKPTFRERARPAEVLGLAAVLAFVGIKMLVSGKWHIPIGVSLGVIAALLGASIVASLLRPAPPEPMPVANTAEFARAMGDPPLDPANERTG